MKIEAFAATFYVTDFARAMKWYVDVLGFEETFRFGDYGGVKRDSCQFHLTSAKGSYSALPGNGRAYVVCDEVDEYHALVVGRGATILFPPKDEPYGLRDFAVADPDGNIINFGKMLGDCDKP